MKQSEKDDFLNQYVLQSNGRNNWCRHFYEPGVRKSPSDDYALSPGEYVICRYLRELIKETRKVKLVEVKQPKGE